MTDTNVLAGAGMADHGMPLLTVVVVTHNSEAHIRECLNGLLEQTIAHRIEIIVVDQGSQQSEWAVVRDLQRLHGNVVSVALPAGATHGAALASAAKLASGSYLSVVAPSDRMRRDAYQLLIAALEQDRQAQLAYGDTRFTAVPHESFENHTSHGTMIWPDYRPDACPESGELPPHAVWRRELHQSVGLPGTGKDGLRDFLAAALQSFPALHLNQFTGLKLATAATLPEQRETDPDRALEGVRLRVQGDDPAQVAAALTEHLQSFPQHALAHNNLAAVSYQCGQTEKALQHYRMAVQLAPQETTYQKNLADILFVSGGVDEAIAIYLELLKRDPRDIETLVNLGIICEDVGQPAEADSFYQRALEIEPWNEAVRERLTALREPAQAAPEAVQPTEEPVEERYQRAQDLAEQGDFPAAARELEAILTSAPDFAAAHNDLAVLDYQMGLKEEALAHYEKATTLAPENSTFRKNLADFYFVEGCNIDGAIAIYLEELRKEPRDVETLMNLGKICVLLDRPREAETFYGKATQLEPWNSAARECLSSVRQCANG